MASPLASALAWRRRWWIALLALLLVLRAALPSALRSILASRASEALRARVEIGDVDLALLRGAVALEDVAVRAEPAAAEPPVAAWKRLYVNLRWLSLPRRLIRLETVELDAPRVALDRLESGDFNVMALVPAAGEPAAAAEPVPAPTPAKPGWGFGIDHLVLRDGGLRFRDLAFPNLEPVEVAVNGIEVADVAFRPDVYGGPSHLNLAVKVDEGTLRLDGRFTPKEKGQALETKLRARRLPLPRTRLYIPNVGWSDLEGEFSAQIFHRFETEARNEARGEIVLDHLAVGVQNLDRPALSWEQLRVYLDRLDLIGQRVAVRTVDLRGASVVMRPQDPVFLPLMDVGAAETKAVAEAAAEAPGKPWHWTVGSVAVRDTVAHLLARDAAADVTVTLGARNLAGEGERVSPVELTLGAGDGSLAFDGSLRIAPLGVEGAVKLAALPLPELVAASGGLSPDVLRSARLDGELAIALGSLGTGGSDVDVRGQLALAEPLLAAADHAEFSVGAQAIALAIEELHVPGVLAPAGAPVAEAPIRVRLQELRLDKPAVQLTRTADGLLLPRLSAAAPGPPAADVPPAEPPPAPPAPAAAPAAGPALELAVTRLQVTGGRVAVTDRTVTPYFQGGFDPLEIDVRKLRWPELAMNRLRFMATNPAGGTLEVTGALAPSGGQLQVNGRELALNPFNPYATSFSPYSIASGRLSLKTKASYGKGRYTADTALSLDGFDLASRGGDSLFQEQFGIPLSMALALLRDVQGRIALDLPVEVDEKGTRIDLVTLVGGALRRAIVNALASPLKLVGAVMGGGGGQALAPAPIPVLVGRDTPLPAGDEQIGQVAAFLASRPGIGVTLAAPLSTADVRWLREQALREELAAPQGMVGVLRTLGERGARERIRKALEERSHDGAGELAPEDAATLEHWLAERPPPADDRLRALADARQATVESRLRERHGVGAERIARREPAAEAVEGAPAVRIELGTVHAAPREAPAG